MSGDAIGTWLAAFDRLVPLRGGAQRRAHAELEAHLMDAAEAATAAGASDPAGQAVQRMGDPALVAAGFARRPRAVVVLALMLWLPAVVASTISVGTAYVIGQQSLRLGANDPQTQIAQDAAGRLAAGAGPAQVADGPQVELDTSLATTVTVLDQRGAVLASTARLQGGTPTPPPGALQAAAGGRTNTITWQPRPGVRQAAVIVGYAGPHGSGTVLVSRSLRLVEQRENDLLALGVAGWLLALVLAGLAAALAAGYWTSRGGPGPGGLGGLGGLGGSGERAWAPA